MKIVRVLTLIAVIVCGTGLNLFAEQSQSEEKVVGNASVSVLNRYIFRGYEIGKSGLVIQPSLTASLKGFSASYWGNIDTNQRNTTTAAFSHEGQKDFNESDFTMSYTRKFGNISLTGGYTFYDVKYAENTEEVFVTLALDTIAKPTLSVFQDITSYPGTYLNLSLAHSFPVYKEITLDIGASFGYMIGDGKFWRTYERSTEDYTGSKYKGLHDGMVKAGLSIPLIKEILLQPSIQYWFPLSGDAKRTMGRDTGGNRIAFNHNGYVPYSLVGGITLIYNF